MREQDLTLIAKEHKAILVVLGRAVPPEEYNFAAGRAQAVCVLIAAHAVCPLDLDLTDGKRHHLLRLRGDHQPGYLDCTPKQVHQYVELVL